MADQTQDNPGASGELPHWWANVPKPLQHGTGEYQPPGYPTSTAFGVPTRFVPGPLNSSRLNQALDELQGQIGSGGGGGPGGALIAGSAPASPAVGDLWWDGVGCQLYVFYDDGNSQQWVPATAGGASAGGIDLRAYGAVCNGVTDDTPAFNAALAALPAAGGKILIPNNTTLGNAVVSKPVTVEGLGGDNAQATVRPLSATTTVFDVSSPFVTLFDFAISPANPSATKQTAGSYINVRSAAHRFRAERLTLTEFHEGVTLGNMSTAELNGIRGYLYSTGLGQSSAFIHVTGGFDVKLIGLSANGPTTDIVNCAAGIWIENCGDCMIVDAAIISMGTDLLVNPGNGQVVASLWVNSSFLDTAYRGVDMRPTGTGAIVRARLSDVWASSHVTHGMRFGAGVDGVDIDSAHVLLNQDSVGANGAIELTGGKNIRIRGGQIAGNLNSGVYVAAGVSDWSVEGVTIGAAAALGGNGGAAVFVNNGASDRYIIRDNIMTGNAGGGITDGGTGTHKTVFGNIGDGSEYVAYREGGTGYLIFAGKQASFSGYRWLTDNGTVRATLSAAGLTTSDLTLATDAGQNAVSGAWSLWSSTVTSASGSGMVTATGSRYKKIGRMVIFQLQIAITSTGTAAGAVNATLPFASQDYNGFGGREGNSGKALAAQLVPSSGSLQISLYDATTPISVGNRLMVSGVYEATT